ncbi:unnamed protein product [Camellia sinensis]
MRASSKSLSLDTNLCVYGLETWQSMAKSHKAHRKVPKPEKPNKTNEKVKWVYNTCQLQFVVANRDHSCGYLGKPIKGVEPKKKE